MTLFAGVDPGARHVAACLLRRELHTFALVSAISLDVDVASLDSVREVVSRVVAFVNVGVVAAGVETVCRVHGVRRGDINAVGAAYAEALAGSNLIAGRIAQALEAEKIEVLTPPASLIRAVYCGTASADDAAVKAVVRLRVRGWPERSNAHERDSGLCALWTAETWAAARRGR